MFRLILVFLLFSLFIVNYFFWFLRTIPDFKIISHFNLYEYLIYRFKYRTWYVPRIYFKTLQNDSGYILDITGITFKTELKYLSHEGDNFKIFIPVFILHTSSNMILSGDSYFSWLKIKKDYWGYTQVISWGNNIIEVWEEIKNKEIKKDNIFLNYLYTYCNLSSIPRIDSYYFNRYLNWNKKDNTKIAKLVPNSYVCPENRTKTQTICSFDICITKSYCTCSDKWEYRICKNWPDGACNIDENNWKWKCINYYTGSINLNNTNCSLTNLTWSSLYFKLR